jgi:hypothetical protein
MSRISRLRWPLRVGLTLTTAVTLAASPLVFAADDRPSAPIEVYEWSVWVGSPAQTSLNAPRVYRNAMPASVGTSRPRFDEKELAKKFPVAPLSIVQTFGDPTTDVDFDLRVKKGTILAQWPQGNERSGRIQWFKSNLTKASPAGFEPGYVPDAHWFQKLRKNDPALYLKYETRVERFLAYDTELILPIPVKIRGGPDEYTLQNLTAQKLIDVAVIAPAEGGGFRVGWLDALPAAVPPELARSAEEKDREVKEKARAKAREKPTAEAKAKAADAVFEEAEAEVRKAREKAKEKAEVKPIPPEGDADMKARVDQILNRPVNLNGGQASRKETLDLAASQARFRYEVDTPTLAKAEVDLSQPMTLKPGSMAARDVLAEALGAVGLSYRVTDDGSLFITTAARLAEEAGKKGAVIEGPPVKLTLAPPLKPSDPSFREATRDSYARRLTAQGMRKEVIEIYLDQYAPTLFEPGGLIVLAHLSKEALDDIVLLDVFPPPKKLVRSALIVSHGVDPRLQDTARALVKQLGDVVPKTREAAETQLAEMGPVAVPALEDALRDRDVEIVLRAERLLLRLNRQVP